MANNIFDDLCDSVLKLIKKRERGVKQDYKAAYRRLRNKLQKIYADYDNGEEIKLTRDEMRKLDVETAKIMANMYKGNEKAVQNTLESILNTSYSAVNTITTKYNIEALARKIDANNIIKKQVAGHIWTERIKKYGNDFVYDVHGIIHQGLDNGDTYTTTARKLKERFGKDIGNTMRIARTESARVLEDSKYQAFNDLANNESVQVFKIWHTMGDEAVRDTHDAMEGVKVLYDEDFILPSGARCQYPKGTGVAAEDINCRCYVEYVTEVVYNKSVEEIAAINGYSPLEQDKVVNVLREESKEWVNILTEDEKKAIIKYTYNGVDPDGLRLFEKINGYLENRYTPKNKDEEEVIMKNIFNIHNGLLKNTLKHDIIVYRYDNDVKNLSEPVFRFLSTSVTKKGVLGGKPNAAIIVPKGTVGAYVETIAHEDYKNQREFILDGGFELKKITNNGIDVYVVKE